MRRRSAKLVLMGVFVAVLVLTARLVYEFLAVSAPLGQDMLVIDAAVPTELLAQVPALFRSGRYRCLPSGATGMGNAVETRRPMLPGPNWKSSDVQPAPWLR